MLDKEMAAQRMKEDPGFYKRIGKKGGKAKVLKGFAVTGDAAEKGRIGGSLSSRRGVPNKSKEEQDAVD